MRISLQGEYRIYVLFRSMLPREYTLYHMYCTSTSYECSVELKSPYPLSSHKASKGNKVFPQMAAPHARAHAFCIT